MCRLSGKTTLLRTVASQVERKSHRLVYFNLTTLTAAGLVRVLARHLRVSICRSQPETIRAISGALDHDPGHTLLTVDEAQFLPPETFSELRTLVEADLSGKRPLAVVFCGMPELRERLQAPALFPLWRRIEHRIEIAGLRLDEARPFARHLLGDEQAARFSDEGLSLLFERSRGEPGSLGSGLRLLCRRIREGPIAPEVIEPIIENWNLA
ncbi:MAG: AAA family ATPase [Nitrospinota bacterium]